MPQRRLAVPAAALHRAVLHVAGSLLHLALSLFRHALGLLLVAARGFARLALHLAGGVLDCALYLVLVHGDLLYIEVSNRQCGLCLEHRPKEAFGKVGQALMMR